jgi:hypothetical protein
LGPSKREGDELRDRGVATARVDREEEMTERETVVEGMMMDGKSVVGMKG